MNFPAKHAPTCLAIAATLFLTAAAAQSASAASTSEVTASGYTSTNDGVTQYPFENITYTTDANGIKHVTGSGATTYLDALGQGSYADVNVMASAGPGVLKAKIHGEASVTSSGPNIPTITNGTPVAVASVGAQFTDQVTIASNTKAIGDPATYSVSFRRAVVTNGPGHVGPQYAGHDSGTWYFYFGVGSDVARTYSGPQEVFGTNLYTHDTGIFHVADIVGHVGDVLPIAATMGLGLNDRAGWYEDDGQLLLYPGGAYEETLIDASHTFQIFIDLLTPGVTLVSDSGHNYSVNAGSTPPPSTTVPAPSAAWAGLVLLGATGIRRGRHRNQVA